MARLFTGIFPPEDAANDLMALRQSGAEEGVRWMPPSNLHATLVFLGYTPDDDVSAITRALASVPLDPFDLAVSGVGAFPKPGAARVLWAGLEPVQPVRRLHDEVRSVLSPVVKNLDGATRSYHPHITVARPKGRRTIDARPWLEHFSAFSGRTFTVRSFVLVDSRTKPQGAEYTVIGRFPPSQ